ncbi:MAG: CaiB/BaiF CoA transferase family protein, partial [Candidatus Binataceae bacterium]
RRPLGSASDGDRAQPAALNARGAAAVGDKEQSPMGLPLEGIRVVDLGQIFAAPYCTLQLAQMGAEIIKIEPPGTGESLRRAESSPGGVGYSFLMLNANKRSVTLNLKHPRGREIVLRIIERADVLVENYSAGVMESFDLGYENLRARFPRLVYASAKGYASNGPWARLGAMDSTVQASSGFMSVTGYPDRSGVKTPVTFIDMGTGSHLVSGILAALLQRERNGRGQKVEVAMLDVCVPALIGLVADQLQGRNPERLGNRHRNACPSDVYPAADGEILIFCLTEAHWRMLARSMGREELIGDPHFKNHAARLDNVEEVDRAVMGWTRGRRRDELIALLIATGVPSAPVRTIEELMADPEVARGGMLLDSEFPTRGAIKIAGSPIKLSEAPQPAGPRMRPPMLGEHTVEVLASVGIDAAEFERLRADGVV